MQQQENSTALEHLNSSQTDQLNAMFHAIYKFSELGRSMAEHW